MHSNRVRVARGIALNVHVENLEVGRRLPGRQLRRAARACHESRQHFAPDSLCLWRAALFSERAALPVGIGQRQVALAATEGSKRNRPGNKTAHRTIEPERIVAV